MLLYIAVVLLIIVFVLVFMMWWESSGDKYIEYEDDVEIISRHKPDGEKFDDYTVIVKYKLMDDIDVLTGKDNYLISTICSYNNTALAIIRRSKSRNGNIYYMVVSFSNRNLNKLMKNERS